MLLLLGLSAGLGPICFLHLAQDLYEELYIELSAAAARSYALCGRLRNAALMRADAADALAARGAHAAAAALYERQARLFLREAWDQLAALVLPKLARCQKVGRDCPVSPRLPMHAGRPLLSCGRNAQNQLGRHAPEPCAPRSAAGWRDRQAGRGSMRSSDTQ